ncbi:MAG: histidine kinase [Caldilineaceae bacterium]|nr:histidine kinase [Caldilineaceae bacterium]
MVEGSPSTVVATLGGQPQVLTFALDALLARNEIINQVIAVRLAAATPAMEQSVAALDAAFAGRRYQGKPCTLHWETLADASGPLGEIRTEAVAEAVWQSMNRVLGRLKAQGRRLNLVVTGGPRIIGLTAMSAATLLFDHQDRLWHLYTPRTLREEARGGRLLHADAWPGDPAGETASDVRLIQLPMAPWGAYFPALRELASASSSQLLAVQSRWMDAGEETRCAAVMQRLTPRQQEVLRAFAQGNSPQDVAEMLHITLKTVDAHKTVILSECRIAWGAPDDERLGYHDLRRRFEGYFRV